MKTDCHVHLDKIGGPHKTCPPTPQMFRDYVAREQLSLVFAIYEHRTTLEAFSHAGLNFVPLFWERRPWDPLIPESAVGIKLHPYIEQYTLNQVNVGPTLELARQRELFVFVHTDDRTPDCSRGKLVAALARDYRDIIFVMAHSGSYAPPKPSEPGQSWVEERVIRELVTEAVEVASTLDNVYLETSILASDTKTQILAKAPIEKMVLGSDFPILAGTPWVSIRWQEDRLLQCGMSNRDIDRLHENAFLFVKSEIKWKTAEAKTNDNP